MQPTIANTRRELARCIARRTKKQGLKQKTKLRVARPFGSAAHTSNVPLWYRGKMQTIMPANTPNDLYPKWALIGFSMSFVEKLCVVIFALHCIVYVLFTNISHAHWETYWLKAKHHSIPISKTTFSSSLQREAQS